MNRTLLEQAIAGLADELGYACTIGGNESMQSTVVRYPAARLLPLRLHRIEGRKHGRIVYEATLHLLRLGMKQPLEVRAQLLARLENDLLELFARLSDHPQVIAVEQLGITPSQARFTSHGEVAQTAQARIITFF